MGGWVTRRPKQEDAEHRKGDEDHVLVFNLTRFPKKAFGLYHGQWIEAQREDNADDSQDHAESSGGALVRHRSCPLLVQVIGLWWHAQDKKQ